MLEKISFAEYIWLDGSRPVQKLRSKTRVLELIKSPALKNFPDWGFDGSSTHQATGSDSDLILKPRYVVRNSLMEGVNYLVLCEVFNKNGNPHNTNHRSRLNKLIKESEKDLDVFFGFEQEYTFFDPKRRWPLGWPDGKSYPEPQGPYYCGIGSEYIFGREIVELHLRTCVEAGLSIYGVNAEVMPSQWEFQIGYRGFKGEKNDPIHACDELWLARYFLLRIAEKYNVQVNFDNKPVKGDWNGAGLHTNFSTASMRSSEKGPEVIKKVLKKLEETHDQHIKNYGHLLEERLTGKHETCSINEFKSNSSDRGASIRIPVDTSEKGYGYLEDRRPGANADPYIIANLLVEACLASS